MPPLMTRTEAKQMLQPHSRKKIASLFDIDDYGVAFVTLFQGFEYPDWSHRTVGGFLMRVKLDETYT